MEIKTAASVLALSVGMMGWGAPLYAENSMVTYSSIGTNVGEPLTLANTMNFANCFNYQSSISIKICLIPMGPILLPMPSWKGQFNYWEPSELIEVSCRKGFSLLLPGGIGNPTKTQACVEPLAGSGGKAQRWFFDARVWAINGSLGAARAQAAGSGIAKRATVCGSNAEKPLPGLRLQGYAIKFDKFSRGGSSGPGQSWEAYISDYDDSENKGYSWAKNDASATPKDAPEQSDSNKCTGSADIEKCWGPLEPLMGWVTHPHQPVAAALAGWRAHEKASGKVSPALSGGYKMNMDYPFIMANSPFGQSMGLPGGGSGGHKGSGCFVPGDPGPWWFTTMQTNVTQEQLPQLINAMRRGDSSKIGVLHKGVYIFTVWVQTGCTLYRGVTGMSVQSAVNNCKDKQPY